MRKLVLCAGHYLGTADRRCLKEYDPNETREWQLNSRVADRVQKLLAGYDVEILRVDDVTGYKYISVSDRVKKGNEWGADFWLGIHHNAGIKGGKGGGISTYVYTTKPAGSVDWQKRLYAKLIEYSPELKGNRASPVTTGNLAEVRDTKMDAVLLELGFMDSSTDIPIIITEEHADKCARAIADVVIEKWSLAKEYNAPSVGVETILYGGAIYTAGNVRENVYATSALSEKVGSLNPSERCNIVCSVGKTYGVLYDITNSKGEPTGEKKLGFIARR